MWHVREGSAKWGLSGELEAKKPLARTGRRCWDNIKIDLEGLELEDIVWLNVACNTDNLWSFASEIIYHQAA